METSPLSVKGCKFSPMLGTHGHRAVRVFLACHTYCKTRHLFIIVISEDPWTHTYCRAFSSGAATTFFTTEICRGWESNTQPFTCATNALTHCTTAAVLGFWFCDKNVIDSIVSDKVSRGMNNDIEKKLCLKRNEQWHRETAMSQEEWTINDIEKQLCLKRNEQLMT